MLGPASTSTSDAFVGRTLRGKYRIVRRLGEGGWGMVFEAEHLLLRKPVALKVLHPDLASDPKFSERFRREALAASQIGHPNIVEVFDLDRTDDGVEFMVLELLHGEDLGARLARKQILSFRETLDIFGQIASALAAAHAAGIVHRDLKPANVLLCARPDGSDLVKIVDFGIAKLDGSLLDGPGSITQTGTLLGTPYYMSPEQIRSERSLDRRTDLYSLGVMFYEALAGRPPFDGPNLPALVGRILYEPYESLAEVRPDLPVGASDLVAALLQREAEDRPTDMSVVVSEIERISGDLAAARAQDVALHRASGATSARPPRTGSTAPDDEETLIVAGSPATGSPDDLDTTVVEGPEVADKMRAQAEAERPVPVRSGERPAMRPAAAVNSAAPSPGASPLPGETTALVGMEEPEPRSLGFVLATIIAVVAAGALSYFVVLHL